MNVSLMFLIAKLLLTKRARGGVFPTTISRAIPAHNSSWSYDASDDGIENWARDYPKCSGTYQSPINIDSKNVVRNESLNLEMSGFSGKIYHAFIENNGHTVHLGLQGGERPSVTGSAVWNNTYVFEQLHFHWGKNSRIGSEHSVDSNFYPLEMHLVLYNKKYENFDQCLNKSDGLVVVAVFFRHSDHENESLQTLINSIQKVPIYGDATELPGIDLDKLMPKNKKNFYRYRGSLTTPPCSEVVTWIILAQPVNIGREQEDTFRRERTNVISSKTGDFSYLDENYRSQVAVNGRKIESSFNHRW
ncbi:carbonic anhydrase 7-like [Brevipalpus obovatus]|uniref:carbonic anhydrase 7-like n=1 Tax=Brevipalpus obovatus TaxID=246614 RepID=UPI003D9E3425